MAAAARRGSKLEMIKRIVVGTLLLGVAVAVLRIFNWDIFALLDWAWYTASTVVNGIADFLTGNGSFRQIFSKPR